MDFDINARKEKPELSVDQAQDYDNRRFWDLQKKRNLVEERKIKVTADDSIINFFADMPKEIPRRSSTFIQAGSFKKFAHTPSANQPR